MPIRNACNRPALRKRQRREVFAFRVSQGPSGKIIATIPFPVNNELPDDEKLTRRVVTLLEERKGWFKVLYYGDKQGWMHKSVLGAYACATEDGDARLKANPDYNAPKYKRQAFLIGCS